MARVADSLAARGDAALIVTHGGVMRMFLEHTSRLTIAPIGNAVVYEVSYEAGRFVVGDLRG
jgi:broad specificity phosphatase PhoE